MLETNHVLLDFLAGGWGIDRSPVSAYSSGAEQQDGRSRGNKEALSGRGV
jgi:hypothetical protein